VGIGVRSGGLALTTTVLGIKVGLGETVRKGLEFGDCASKAQPIEAVATNPINNNSNPASQLGFYERSAHFVRMTKSLTFYCCKRHKCMQEDVLLDTTHLVDLILFT